MDICPPILRDLPTELVGDRLLLRPYREGDGEAIFAAIDESRERLAPWLPFALTTRSLEDSEAFARQSAAKWLLRESLNFGMWHRQSNVYLGAVGLHVLDWDVPSFEIGYWIRSSMEGKGLVSESVRLVCTLAFERLDAVRIIIRCDAANVRSAATAARAGFTQEARLRCNAWGTGGSLRDTLLFAMLRADYQAVASGL